MDNSVKKNKNKSTNKQTKNPKKPNTTIGYLVSRVPLISWISCKAMVTLNNTFYTDTFMV